MNLRAYLDFATELAFDAGRLTLGYFGRASLEGLEGTEYTEYKDDDSPVTRADREAEALIRRRLEARYPDHAVVGEEYGETNAGSTHRWFVDPIDGTKAFVRGVPLYGVLLGLEIEGRVEVGVAYFPALNEMCAAATGLGCTLNGRAVRVSEVTTLARATVAHTDAGAFARYGREGAWRRVARAAYDRRGWSDAYGHMLVATGRAEVMLDPVMNAWDCGPFPALLREAGGFFGDWSGRETIHGGEAMSTTRALLPELLALIGEGDAPAADGAQATF
ncbi:inositol monophosphatase family protein [Truepera radiovictrix]|uniref:Inositol monophosphatase n=1 Tax=Truepera radiovictrix (strain DSM 17093 / CIP 108686 / LMG 22925 / RQ-24) TaxID=649638 RepID=D7CSE9_TRURR|nr:inositol monophosphatase family protein [Truepera radiovictrix]ADI15369.1 inositol monophosphatase [Truepera radiovictrix DSM 17093]WMT56080.1 inositol monophosphatase family protein [Truepera radiovictrix]